MGSPHFEVIEIDPSMYCGIALDADEETIPFAIAQRLRLDGSLSLWQFQRGWNHHHPAIRGFVDLQCEIETFHAWRKTLLDRFPDESFVIEQIPLNSMTWFQALPEAPTHDEPDWRIFPALHEIPAREFLEKLKSMSPTDMVKNLGSEFDEAMRIAESRQVLDVRLHPLHRGVQIATDALTGETVAYATRTIRTLIRT